MQGDACAGRPGPVIVCATDDHYAMPAAVMMYSALVNYQGSEPIQFLVIDAGISRPNRARIARVLSRFPCSLRWLTPSQPLGEDLPLVPWATTTTYYRILLPELVPGAIEKVLYLDSDVLVLGDVSGLWEQEVQGYYVLAAQDKGIPNMAAADHLNGCPGIPGDGEVEYFNAGVLVVNLTQWRLDDFSGQTWSRLRRDLQFMRYMDQDALNVAAAGRWGRLSGLWNQCIPTWERDNAVRPDPAGIIHFTGPNKPWQGTATYPARAIFDDYLRGSGWHGDKDWFRYRWTRAGHRRVTRIVDRAGKALARARDLARKVRRVVRPPFRF